MGATGLVPRTPRELRVRVLEPTLLCYLGRGDLERLARSNPEVGLALARLLAGRLVGMEARWADVAAKEVSARLASSSCCSSRARASSRPRATGYPSVTPTGR